MWVDLLVCWVQHAKKVVSGSPGRVDLAVGLVNSVINLPNGQVNFLGRNSNYRRTVINPAHQIFGVLVEMTFGLVHASYSLAEWQAVKLTFFALCGYLARLANQNPNPFIVFSMTKRPNVGYFWQM